MAISRREFLKMMALSLGGIPARSILPSPLRRARRFAKANPTVAVVTGKEFGDDLALMTRHAISLATGGNGMSSIVKPGDMVFIKPNLTAMAKPSTGDTTKPPIIAAVAEECLKAGASRVIIGEGAGQHHINPHNFGDKAFGYLGDYIADLNARYGNRVMAVDIKCASYHIFYPAIAPMQTFCLPHYAAEADVVISIPVLKTHMECLVVLGIKNLFGLGSPTIYDAPRHKLHQGFPDYQQLHQILVDIAQALRPNLTIMDASIGLEGNGPHHFNEGAYTVDVRDRLGHWLVLASTDIVALDATSTRVMGLEPARSRHLVLAQEQGLGEGRKEYIEIVGTPLSEVQMDWLRPVKGIQYERRQVEVPVPAVPDVQRGPIVSANRAVGAWKTGYLRWASASVAYLDTPYTNPTPPPGSERTSAVGFHVDREGTYIIFGRALVDLSTQTDYPPDWIASMVRDTEGVKQWEMIYQRAAPCHTWYFWETAWHWYSYGMYRLKPGAYVLSFKSAHLLEKMAIHCFAVLPLVPLPDGRAAIVPPFKPLEARGTGWSPRAQLLVSKTPGAQAKVHFEMPITAIYDVYLVALIPNGYRLWVALENRGKVREVEVVGSDDRWEVYPLGSFSWERGQGSFTFTNDQDNGNKAMKVDALLLVPRPHRV